MKKTFLNTFKIVVVGVLLAGGITYASTWVAPTSAPTGGNPDAPINIGPTGQIKLGGLTLGAGTGVSQAFTVLNGKSGFGFATIPSNLLADVNGSIGAKQYCDEKGLNCVPASDIGTTGGGSCSIKIKTITQNPPIGNPTTDIPTGISNTVYPHAFATYSAVNTDTGHEISWIEARANADGTWHI